MTLKQLTVDVLMMNTLELSFLAPKGALEMLMFVCLSVCPSVFLSDYAPKLQESFNKSS